MFNRLGLSIYPVNVIQLSEKADIITTSNKSTSNSMRDMHELFAALAWSKFRSGFKLQTKERAYLEEKTLPVVLDHGRKFLEEALGPRTSAQRRPANTHARTSGVRGPTCHGHLLPRLPGKMAPHSSRPAFIRSRDRLYIRSDPTLVDEQPCRIKIADLPFTICSLPFSASPGR